VWRLLQCLRQFRDEKRDPKHLKNALKYSTAFPVIIFSAMQRQYRGTSQEETLFLLWLISAAINSCYSFYWDVAYDWDLGSSSARFPLLRDHLVFRNPLLYYAAILLDLMLRLSWSLRLSSLLHIEAAAWGTLFLETLEIFRRMVWIFFRLENQHLKLSKIVP